MSSVGGTMSCNFGILGINSSVYLRYERILKSSLWDYTTSATIEGDINWFRECRRWGYGIPVVAFPA